jgi:toxin ParE1/3/4
MRPMTSPRSSSASAKTIPPQRVARTLYTAVAELRNFPNRGRKGLAPGTRELVFPPWPLIVVYEVADTQLNFLRIRHASQDWP